MEKAITKVGSILISKKAKQELSTITDELSSISSTIEGKAKWVYNKLKGKTQKPLPDLLRDFNLPAGLFPQNITCYEFDEPRSKLIVYMSSPCEVCFKDSSIVRYANRVKATLSKGKLAHIEGMKTKVLVWVKVTSINVESYTSDKVWFIAGVKKCRPKHAYQILRDAVKVDEF
ncbi:uncharacterized protein At5g01610-like [Amaranthus tricolor]|uniref:uncharacterized protein At5g01610-like n=1 Tax=Amaranthus tricolor TaxID=29722 RepID=UPI002590A473|nr:uncharacterized protein At5g01610-like [Amaranthus tricolor]